MMAGSIIGEVSALRWNLPVQTPSDESTQDRMECVAIDASAKLVRDTPLERQRVPDNSLTEGGENADAEAAPNIAFGLRSGDIEGRAAVSAAADERG